MIARLTFDVWAREPPSQLTSVIHQDVTKASQESRIKEVEQLIFS